MPPIQIRKNPDRPGTSQLLINGADFSNDVFRDIRLVEVGEDPEFSEIGVQITFAVGAVDLDPECLTADERPYEKAIAEIRKELGRLSDAVRRGASNAQRNRRAV